MRTRGLFINESALSLSRLCYQDGEAHAIQSSCIFGGQPEALALFKSGGIGRTECIDVKIGHEHVPAAIVQSRQSMGSVQTWTDLAAVIVTVQVCFHVEQRPGR